MEVSNSLPLLLFSFVSEIVIGSAIGLCTAGVIFGAHLTKKTACQVMIASATVFLASTWICGWAGEHSAIVNGQRLDIAPWGEDLRIRNWFAENEAWLSFGGSFAAAFASSALRTSRMSIFDPRTKHRYRK